MNLKAKICWLGHPALGAFTLICGYINPALAIAWVYLYAKYESNEDHWIHDRAYIDVKDFMIGLAAGVIIVLIYVVLMVKGG
jgi:hypothetical protein